MGASAISVGTTLGSALYRRGPAGRRVLLRHLRLESTAAGAGRAVRFLTASLARELGILLTLSVMFPFLVHVLPVPEDARLGPRLLPMFYAPLLATLVGRTRSALIVAVVAPWLNWALTAHPLPPGALMMTIELLAFVLALRSLPAYLTSMAAAVLAAGVFPGLIGNRAALGWAAQSLATGLPGVAILLLINWLVIRCYPSGPAGGGPRAA